MRQVISQDYDVPGSIYFINKGSAAVKAAILRVGKPPSHFMLTQCIPLGHTDVLTSTL